MNERNYTHQSENRFLQRASDPFGVKNSTLQKLQQRRTFLKPLPHGLMEIVVEKSIGWLHLMKAHPGKSGARMTVFSSQKEILRLELGMYVPCMNNQKQLKS